MQEHVGKCRKCGMDIRCLDGFLNGVVAAGGELYCFGCADHSFTIDCADILLREYEWRDLDAIHMLTWQPEIHEWLPGWNVGKEQRMDWLSNYEIKENKAFLHAVAAGGQIGELRLRMVIVLKETDEVIGWCCTGVKEEFPAKGRQIMFAISKDHRGKGYTTQAAQGLSDYLFANTDTCELHAAALLTNEPSNRVIQKSGFVFSSTITMEGELYHHYVYGKPDWLRRRQTNLS
ncbi:RimJ/RimL family protein N-acetyltransferase [Paenibacillus endophyticus]|uniref:RimJ/RimL family protein N-acetyltransferase n=1 Tax=Paenibacillus endophyticus TaxID=1294268 RepID=A0A7W5C4T9_9BACL|nr:GNAT family N-acetyltransferase [Paenibacillus endophyticus]MBB3151216.1 RimJ/RimL family protein N-acetyltransferase [Paenibacillus endophyticus]